jgi:DNA-binding LacI/PurR family transcriptional regulator
MRLLCHELRHRHYKRIGLFLPKKWDRYDYNRSRAAHWVEYQLYHHPADYIPPLLLPEETLASPSMVNPIPLKQWIKKWKPDVLVSAHPAMIDWVRQCGYKVPETIGYAALDLPENTPGPVAGLFQNVDLLGRAAMTLLHNQLLTGQLGLPAVPQGTAVSMTWIPGKSIRDFSQG